MTSDDRISALNAAAQEWVGTPFCEHSAVRGAGVCCHLLPYSILRDAGWLPALSVPSAPPGWSRAGNRGLIAPWLDACPMFAPVASFEAAQPGDVLGFRIGLHVHHLGLLLRSGDPCRFIHAAEHIGTRIETSMPRTWARRLERIWRPLP
jgi:cell wall-associated NlpC family hydrolase